MIVSALPKRRMCIMAQFVAATSPSGEASYLINLDKIIYIMQTLTGESVLHFGEDETLHIGMKPQEFIDHGLHIKGSAARRKAPCDRQVALDRLSTRNNLDTCSCSFMVHHRRGRTNFKDDRVCSVRRFCDPHRNQRMA